MGITNIKLSNDRNVKFTPINVNMIELVTNATLVELVNGKLNIDDIYNIKLNDKIEIQLEDKLEDYTVREFRKINNGTYLLIETPQNVSTMFLTPMLGLVKDDYLFDTYLMNTYARISEEIGKSHNECIYLLYKFSSSDVFLQFEKRIKKHPLFVSILDPTYRHIIIVMKIPTVYKNDMYNILNGKYSKITSKYQNRIIKFHKHDISNSPFIDIFNKSIKRRIKLSKKIGHNISEKSELYDKPNLKNETLWYL
jgi:hypothetical protein